MCHIGYTSCTLACINNFARCGRLSHFHQRDDVHLRPFLLIASSFWVRRMKWQLTHSLTYLEPVVICSNLEDPVTYILNNTIPDCISVARERSDESSFRTTQPSGEGRESGLCASQQKCNLLAVAHFYWLSLLRRAKGINCNQQKRKKRRLPFFSTFEPPHIQFFPQLHLSPKHSSSRLAACIVRLIYTLSIVPFPNLLLGHC